MMKQKREVNHALEHPSDSKVILELIQYNEKDHHRFNDLPVNEMLAKMREDCVNWVNVDGFHDSSLISTIGEYFNLHSLLLEDIMVDHPPKLEEYEDHIFITMKMLYRIDDGQVDYEQISFIMGDNFVVSVQEKPGDPFNSLRERIRQDLGRVRKMGADYLLYRCMDIIVDNYYTILSTVGEQIENIEETVFEKAGNDVFRKIQHIKKELLYLRRALYPLRDALSLLLKEENRFITPECRRFYSDVNDHIIHLTESLEIYRDIVSGLMDVCMTTLNTRMNEVIKVLTIISTIFIPLTFIVGIYGMNFDYMPELRMHFGYPAVMIFMGALVVAMAVYFKYKKWF